MLLEESRTSDHFEKLSKIQAMAVADLISAETETLSNEVKSELAGDVVKLAWAKPDHCGIVLERLVSSEARRAEPARRRRQQQDFRKIYAYLTQAMWDALKNAQSSADAKLSAVLQHALRLGLRLPTEPTSKMLTSIWILSTSEDIGTLDNVSKAIKYKRVKDEFDQLRRKGVDPVVWIEQLPDDPLTFQHKFPAVYEQCFGRAPPVPPAISPDVIMAFDMSYSCRGGLKQAVPLAASTTSIAVVAKPLGVPAMQNVDMGNFQQIAVSFMQQMQTSQQRLIEMIIGNGASSRQVSLASLHDRAQLNRESFAVPPLRPALPAPAFIEEVDSPPTVPKYARSASLVLPPEQTPALTNGAAEELVAGAAAEHDDVEDMLDMIAARKASNAAAAKAAKAAATAKAAEVVVAAGAAAKPPAGAKPPAFAKPPAASKPPAFAKTPAAAKPPAFAKPPAAAKPPAKAGKAKANATAKATRAVPELALEPPKTKAKTAAKPGAAPAPMPKALVLGCGRCRFGPTGCSTCRRPEFSGIRGSASGSRSAAR